MPFPNPDSTPFNPEMVFEPAYWGELIPRPRNPVTNFPSLNSTTANTLLAPHITPVLLGREGEAVSPGVIFDTTDEHIQSARHHIPGTVLLADVEFRGIPVPDHNYGTDGSGELIQMSTRNFFQNQGLVENDPADFAPTSYTFLSPKGDEIYGRKVNLLTITGRRGRIFELVQATSAVEPPDIEQTPQVNVATVEWGSNLMPLAIGQTYTSPGAYTHRRLRSLDIIHQGKPIHDAPATSQGHLSALLNRLRLFGN